MVAAIVVFAMTVGMLCRPRLEASEAGFETNESVYELLS